MSAASTDHNSTDRTLKLGELLYADPGVLLVAEKQWLSLVHAMAAGDKSALRVLYEKALPVVFNYLVRLTGDQRLTETLVVDVFELLWCEAPVFDAAEGPVLGWIMRRARSRALSQANTDRSTSSNALPDRPTVAAPLERALEILTTEERQVLEGALIHGFSYPELAAQYGQSIGTIKNWVRSGLVKMQEILQAPGDQG